MSKDKELYWNQSHMQLQWKRIKRKIIDTINWIINKMISSHFGYYWNVAISYFVSYWLALLYRCIYFFVYVKLLTKSRLWIELIIRSVVKKHIDVCSLKLVKTLIIINYVDNIIAIYVCLLRYRMYYIYWF